MELPNSYCMKKPHTVPQWQLEAAADNGRRIELSREHPVFEHSLPGLTLSFSVDVAGAPSGGYARTKAANDLCVFIPPSDFDDIIAAMLSIDRDATLKALAKAILNT